MPDDVAFDVELGARIRLFRMRSGISQGDLGKALGVSFQQVQKYEGGRDRVSASTLRKVSHALRVAPSEFFETASGEASDLTMRDMRDAVSLSAGVARLPPQLRRQVLALVEQLVATVSPPD